MLDEDGNPVMERPPFDPATNVEQADVVKEILAEVLAPWQEAGDQVIVPAEDQIPEDNRTPEEIGESIAKGRDLFYGTKANCFTCHGPTGLGDGQQTDYDIWSKEQKAFDDATIQLQESIVSQKRKSPDSVARVKRQRRKRRSSLPTRRSGLAPASRP